MIIDAHPHLISTSLSASLRLRRFWILFLASNASHRPTGKNNHIWSWTPAASLREGSEIITWDITGCSFVRPNDLGFNSIFMVLAYLKGSFQAFEIKVHEICSTWCMHMDMPYILIHNHDMIAHVPLVWDKHIDPWIKRANIGRRPPWGFWGHPHNGPATSDFQAVLQGPAL